MTTTTSTTSSVSSASSIAKTLGAGSGIDLGALVDSLVTNQFQLKNQQLSAQADKLTAQISGLAKLKSGITGFASALQSLVKGGTLTGQPTTSNASAIRTSVIPGAAVSTVSSSIVVNRLATNQTATTNATGLKRGDTIGTGTITFSFGTRATPGDASTFSATSPADGFTLDITSTDGTLDGIAKKINGANKGVTASVVTAANGDARLVIKGPTGAAKAFEISTSDTGSSGPGLAILNTSGSGGATTIAGTPQDAELVVDGVTVTRASNSVTDLVPGVQLDLLQTTASAVNIASTVPTDALNQAVKDVVDTYNEMHSVIVEQTNAKSGTLAGDGASNQLARTLAGITLVPLVSGVPSGAPTTLAEIGVKTNRDGTLSVDQTQLTRAMTQWPEVVEAMFADGTGATGNGLSAALNAISTTTTSPTYGLDATTARLTQAQSDLAKAQDKASSDADALRTRMTQQFSAMDARVAAYKSTQAFLTQQIDMWTKSDN
ncbi:Flagellar hook-associated protein 2 [Sphingomonas sp. EC-HK361]|uniref:flagellar filament capping protein FliD n=1 Tax=Sphingomonas sp. EC-HK361 TaxID=2038397 RepID=UPI001254BBB1|nr:flagellar filament capping protein FliD [Sphingomonas sp. EC-HK361]VVT20605.1 Flagellar hook-associated protein 2 [Sphingomonas sp. EC-HK361]